ncbi:MAG: cytochrome c [Ignavibacteria bacterium]|jgi:mono/diheme cytochrome c family protein
MLGENDNINLEVNTKKNVFLRLYGLLYVLIICLIIGLGILYLNNIEYFSTEEAVPPKPAGSDTATTEELDLPAVKGAISPPVDVKKLSVSTPEMVEKGKTLFTANCVSCHGENGDGNGIAGASLNPKPRNFHDLTGWKNGPKLTQIYKTLQEGISGSAMASFSTLTPGDRFALIHYVQSFRNDYPAVTDPELNALDKTYSLSAGVKQPNQIPVRTAEELVIKDYKTMDDEQKKISGEIKNGNEEGAVIFKKISSNIDESVRILLSNARWNENENEFVNLITTEPVYNGFKTNVYQLSSQDISTVYQYLKKIFRSYKAS